MKVQQMSSQKLIGLRNKISKKGNELRNQLDVLEKEGWLIKEEIRRRSLKYKTGDRVLVKDADRLVVYTLQKGFVRLRMWEFSKEIGYWCRGDRISENEIICKVSQIQKISSTCVTYRDEKYKTHEVTHTGKPFKPKK